MDDVADNLIHHVDIASKGQAALRKMPEFVSQDRLEFAEIDAVDEAKTDQQIFSRRNDQVQQRQVVNDRGVDVRTGVDARRPRRADLIAKPVDELEQLRVLGSLQFDV